MSHAHDELGPHRSPRGLRSAQGFTLIEIMVVVFILVVWVFPNSHELLASHQPALEYAQDPPKVSLAPTPGWLGRLLTWRPNLVWALLLAGLMVSGILNMSRPTEFIYWQF